MVHKKMKVKHFSEEVSGKKRMGEFVSIDKGKKSVYVFLNEIRVETPRTSKKLKW